MKIVRLEKSPVLELATLAVAVAAIAGTAGIATDQAGAAIGRGVDRAPHPAKVQFKRPKVKHGVLTVKGTGKSEQIVLRLKAGHPGVLQVDIDDGKAVFSFDRTGITAIEADAGAGDDLVRIDEDNGIFTDAIPTSIDGGNGDDNLVGGSGAETLRGGEGNDTIDGNRGNDLGQMGSGDDTFVWDPGDGSDVLEGQAGLDTMLFNGANASEQVELSTNGSRLRFFRDVAGITMDTAGVERVDFNALGGADLVTVNDLTGTDVTSVIVDLAGALGGAAGDGEADRIVVNGTDGNDAITVTGDTGGVKVSGLAATVESLHSEVAKDKLEVDTLEGRDSVDSAGLAAGVIQLLVDGVLVP